MACLLASLDMPLVLEQKRDSFLGKVNFDYYGFRSGQSPVNVDLEGRFAKT